MGPPDKRTPASDDGRRNPSNFNDLPIWRVTREAELRSLPPAARKLANRLGIEGTTARLLTSLAGIGGEVD